MSALISPVFCVAQTGILRTASVRLARWVIRRSTGTTPIAYGRNHALKVFRGSVAASEEGHFLAVEIRIHERDRVLDHADEHVAAAVGDELETPFHGRLVARGVKYNIKAIAPSKRHDRLRSVALGWN